MSADEQNQGASPPAAAAAPPAVEDTATAPQAVLAQTSQLVSASFQSAVSWLSSATSALGHFVEEAVAAEDAQAAQHEREEAEAAHGASALSESSPIDPTAAPLDYAVTPALLEFVDALSEHDDTFLRFPRAHQSFRLSALQESHARSVLAASPALARMRYRLAPSQIKEQEFWRIYFILFANVARKIKATESAAAPSAPTESTHNQRGSSTASSSAAASPARPSAGDASPAAVVSDAATAAASSPVAAIPLDLREADRLCGLDHMHGRRSSSLLSDSGLEVDDEDQLDPQTDALIADILRRQRLGSNSLPSPAALHSLQPQQQHTPLKSRASAHTAQSLSAEFASAASSEDVDALNTSDLGVTEAELDEALQQQQQQGDTPASPAIGEGHARAESLALSSAAELP